MGPQNIVDTSSRRFLPMDSTGTPHAAIPRAAITAIKPGAPRVSPVGTPSVSYVPQPETLGIQSSPQNIVDTSSRRFLPMDNTGTPHAATPGTPRRSQQPF